MIENKDKYTGKALNLLNELEKAIVSKHLLAPVKVQTILNRLLAEYDLTITTGEKNESTERTENQNHEQRNLDNHGRESSNGNSAEFALR